MKISALALGLLLIAGLVWYKGAGAAAHPKPIAFATTITVTTTADTTANDGVCSLREAIAAANNNVASGAAAGECPAGMPGATPDNIIFNIGGGTPTIGITSALPTITEPVTINGNGIATRVELNGTVAGGSANGLTISAGSSTIKSLVINRFNQVGIRIDTNGGNTIQGCYIGTDAMGTADQGNNNDGIYCITANNIIGGTIANTGNVISGNNSDGIELGTGANGNQIQGNLIGTNAAGTGGLGNSNNGVFVNGGASNIIGGTATGSRNLLSGNVGAGINFGNANGNQVLGNLIGTNSAGSAAIANGIGVTLANSNNNTFGGTTVVARNVISGNTTHGLRYEFSSSGNQAQGNFIGINLNDTAALPNGGDGVKVDSGSSSNTIGGTATGAGNVISGNTNSGVEITSATTTLNKVLGNFIGTNNGGTTVRPNGLQGVTLIDSPNNTIGGATVPERNIISGNIQNDVIIDGSSATGNLVQGNYIGTNAAGISALSSGNGGVAVFHSANNTSILNNVISGHLHGVNIAFSTSNCIVRGNLIGTNAAGTAGIGNNAVGVLINISSNNNTVGGTTASDRNVISANSGGGVAIGSNSTGNTVLGNFIGTNAAGTAAISNGLQGVVVIDSPNNTIGGTVAGAGNLIAFNSQKGVDITGVSATGNRVLTNLIFSNGALGIDLNDDGVTANDAGDGDTGPNKRQNFPVLTQVFPNLIKGTLNSAANTTFIIQLFSNLACDASGNGEGQTYLGQTNVTTDGSGNATINFTPITSLSPGAVITTTATDPGGNTSEFSACQVVTPCPTIILTPLQIPNGSVGVSYAQNLTASGGCAPYTFSVSAGFLPPNLTLSPTGVISGTPTQCGSFMATIKVTDSCGCMIEQNYPLTILSRPRTYRAGNMDDFQLPSDPTSPRAALVAQFGNPLQKNFDDPTINRWVMHSFTGLPNNIVKAELEVRMQPGDSASNDSINFIFPPNTSVTWGQQMSVLNPPWNLPQAPFTFNFDLGNLPVAGTQQTNLLALLNTHHLLDIAIQDDTTVDYIKLRIWTCPPRPYFFGLPHDAIGQAQLTQSANGNVIVSNLSGTGDNGIFVQLDQAQGVCIGFATSVCLGVGTAMDLSVNGVGGDVATAAHLMFTYNSSTGLVEIRAVFPDQNACVYVRVCKNNVDQNSFDCLASGTLLASVPPGTCIKEIDWIDFNNIDRGFSLLFDQATNVTIPGSGTYNGERLKVFPDIIVGGGGIGPFISNFSVVTQGIPSFTLEGEKVRTFGLFGMASGNSSLEPFAGNLAVAGIGSSGEDGVTIDLGKTDAFDFGLDPIDLMGTAPVGAFLQAEAFGSRNGLLNQSLGKLQATKTATDYLFTADFSAIGSTTQHIQIFNGNTLVIDLPLHTGPVGNASAWARRIGKLGGGGADFISDFDPGTTFRIGGMPYPITQLRVLAEGATGTIEFKSGLALRGSGIGEFTLTSGDIFCPPVINVLPQTLQPGTTGVSYPLVQFSTSTSLDPFTYTVTGSLPNGMTVTPDGKLSGTPSQSGSFNFVVRSENQQGCFGEQPYTLVIICPTITINPATPTLPAGTAGTPYNQPLTQTGSVASVAWSISAGLLPPGVTLNPTTGLLSGTPTGFGIFTFTVRVTDANGCMGVQAYTLTISCPSGTVTVNPATLPNGVVGTAFNQTLTATGGSSSYTFTISGGAVPTGVTLSSGGVLSGVATAAGTFNFTVKATDTNDCVGTRSYTVIISGNGSNGLQFYPLPRPVRLLDTRANQGNCDNIAAPIGAGTTITTLARITCESITIPPIAQAIVGNITVLNGTPDAGFLTIYPAGLPLPLAANMIYGPGAILANGFTVGLSSDGKFNIFGERTIDVVVDISGYYAPPQPAGLYYHPLSTPIRLLDTRAGFGNCDNVSAPIPAGTSLTTLARTTCETLTIPAAAQAIVGNATVINGSGQVGYLTIYPNGVPVPLAANIIYFPGQILSNAFTTSLNANGEFNIFAERMIHIVVDVAGYYSNEAVDANGPGLLFTPLVRPLRIMDTRAGEGNCDVVSVPITGGGSIAMPTWLTCESITIPNTARTVLGNVTVINLTPDAGYLTLYPDGVPQPLAANMVYFPGQILSNAFAVGVNTGTGQFRIFAERTLHAIVDVSGYFAP